MIIDGHTIPCYSADGICEPTTKTPYTFVWFSDNFCLIFTIKDFVGRMTNIEDRFWIKTDSFIHSSIPNISDTTYGIKGTRFPFFHDPHTQNPHNRSLSRFERFPHAKDFCSEPEPLYATHFSDLFVTYTNVSTCMQDYQLQIQ